MKCDATGPRPVVALLLALREGQFGRGCSATPPANADLLVGPNGWASSGCPGTGLQASQLRSNLINNWLQSGRQTNSDGSPKNIWFDIFTQDMNAFSELCVVKELWQPAGDTCPFTVQSAIIHMCTGDNENYKNSKMWMLFDGGLCRVAFEHTDTDISAQDLFAYFFTSPPTIPIDCGGSYAAGAVSGATGAASSMLGVAAMATGPAFLLASVVTTVGAGVAGAIAGGMASQDACKQKGSD